MACLDAREDTLITMPRFLVIILGSNMRKNISVGTELKWRTFSESSQVSSKNSDNLLPSAPKFATGVRVRTRKKKLLRRSQCLRRDSRTTDIIDKHRDELILRKLFLNAGVKCSILFKGLKICHYY